MKKRKWLLFGGYNPSKSLIGDYLLDFSNQLDILLNSCEHIFIMGDFNSEIEDKMTDFSDMYNLSNLIKDYTCYNRPSINHQHYVFSKFENIRDRFIRFP